MSALHRFMPQVMLVLGILTVLICYFADVIGLGSPGLGTRQLLGTLFGLVLVVNGLTIWAVRERG